MADPRMDCDGRRRAAGLMLQHFPAWNGITHVVAYHAGAGATVVMECPSAEVAQREANRLNAEALFNEPPAPRVRDWPTPLRLQPKEQIYGPQYGDFAD